MSFFHHHHEGEHHEEEHHDEHHDEHHSSHTGLKIALGLGALGAVAVAGTAAVVGVAAVGVFAGHKLYKNHEAHVQDGSHFRLHINVIKGENLKNKEWIGKSNPFVVVDIGDMKVKTKPAHHNLNPVWEETIECGVLEKNMHHHIIVEVHDDETFSSDLLGKAFLNWDQIPHDERKHFTLALDTQGEIHVELWTSGSHH